MFSQYYDTVRWHARQLSQDLPDEPIGLYAGGSTSGILRNGAFRTTAKDEIKAQLKTGALRLVFGTDAASEGLNPQRLGTLVTLDLPWNPTRLEQGKGRIQRIGQLRDVVLILNRRYRGSVEDRVYHLLSQRLENIRDLFGQIPDMLEDVWVETALGQEQRAEERIDYVPERHPFEMKYDQIERVDWENCATVLNEVEQKRVFMAGWSVR